MAKHKDIYFQDAEGTTAATKGGDKVALALNNPPSFLNKLRFYTVVFNYGNEWQQYLTEDEKNGLCFANGDKYQMRVYDSYEQAKQVMGKLSDASFPNEGVLQVCSLELSAVGEPSKGNPDFLGGILKSK